MYYKYKHTNDGTHWHVALTRCTVDKEHCTKINWKKVKIKIWEHYASRLILNNSRKLKREKKINALRTILVGFSCKLSLATFLPYIHLKDFVETKFWIALYWLRRAIRWKDKQFTLTLSNKITDWGTVPFLCSNVGNQLTKYRHKNYSDTNRNRYF